MCVYVFFSVCAIGQNRRVRRVVQQIFPTTKTQRNHEKSNHISKAVVTERVIVCAIFFYFGS